MRIVVWNCAMALHAKCEHLMALRPDVAVVPECAQPEILMKKIPDFAFDDCEWGGIQKDKGLGVFSFNGHALRRHESWDAQYHIFIPVEVRGATRFNLLAVWAFQKRTPQTVAPNPATTREAVDHYADFIRDRGVIAGDFNASVFWDHTKRYASFAELNERLSQLGLASAYHEHRHVPFGQEPEQTHFWQHKANQLFHIDYAYVPKTWLANVREVSIGSVADWIKRSDHAPLVVDDGR